MSFPGFILRTGSVVQNLFPSESPPDEFVYAEFGVPSSLVYETEDYISAGFGGLFQLGSGGSGVTLGAAFIAQLFDWNDVILIDSLLMPGISFSDESCPQNTVMSSEDQCGVSSAVDEEGTVVSIATESCGSLVIVDESSSPVTLLTEV